VAPNDTAALTSLETAEGSQIECTVITGPKRGITPSIKRELRRGAAVEPVLKAAHRTGGNYLSQLR